MNPYYFADEEPQFDYGPATWTDLMRLQECRTRVSESKTRLRILAARASNPIEIVEERIHLQGAEWQLHQLESKFELKPSYF